MDCKDKAVDDWIFSYQSRANDYSAESVKINGHCVNQMVFFQPKQQLSVLCQGNKINAHNQCTNDSATRYLQHQQIMIRASNKGCRLRQSVITDCGTLVDYFRIFVQLDQTQMFRFSYSSHDLDFVSQKKLLKKEIKSDMEKCVKRDISIKANGCFVLLTISAKHDDRARFEILLGRTYYCLPICHS